MDLTIVPHPNPHTDEPVIVFGFTSEEFSQCVYMKVPEDPQQCLAYADELYRNFIEACATAVKTHKSAKSVRSTFKATP